MNPMEKPSLLLHCCCAPCVTHPIRSLLDDFDVTAFFYNPNIHPPGEYQERLKEIEDLAKRWDFPLIVGPYEKDGWFAAVKGHEDEPEGGERCAVCYRMRLEKTATIAKEKRIDWFASTLSISPHKNAALINNIGKGIESCLDVMYLETDFKKKDGFKISCGLSREEGLYRQDYCGCVFSRKRMS
jgi:predicted adenine nucleotide alpha hydrolase (AANH) superfamily ATPase